MATTRLRSARAELVSGTSTRRERSFIAGEPAWLRIGSGPEADWQLRDEGVAPAHCELLWDGQGLFVQDRLRLGNTRVNGKRVDGWWALPGDALIYLATVRVRTNSPREQPEEPSAGALRWVQQQLLARDPGGETRQ